MSDPKDPGKPGAEDGDATILRSAKEFYGNQPVPTKDESSRADRVMGRRKDESSGASAQSGPSGGPARAAGSQNSGSAPQRSQGPVPQRAAQSSAPSGQPSGPSRGGTPATTERIAASRPAAAKDRPAASGNQQQGSPRVRTDQQSSPAGRPGFNAPAAGASGKASGAPGGMPSSAPSAPGQAGAAGQKAPAAGQQTDAGQKSGGAVKAAAAGGALGAAGGALASRLKGLRGGGSGATAGGATTTGKTAAAVPAPRAKDDTSEPDHVSSSASTTGSQPAVRRGARRTRKARLRLAQIDPWSVMKTAFLFSVAAGIVLWVATGTVWAVIGSSGIFESINSMIGSIIQTPGDDTPFRIQDYVDTNRVMGTAALIAVIDVVIFTALATLAAFLYNLASAMIGGLEVTLAED